MTGALRFAAGGQALDVPVAALVVAGWTGRDAAGVQHHIDELAAVGVPGPSTVPLFYRVARGLLTQDGAVEVLGPETSGEAEPLLLRHGGRDWLGLASDHTDRGLERVSVAASKQACAKVCAATLWPLDEVAGHLDLLELRSWIDDGAALYQDGTLGQIRPLAELAAAAPLAEGTAMLCGTVPAIGGIRPSASFRAELRDPVLGRSITLDYRVTVLPVIS